MGQINRYPFLSPSETDCDLWDEATPVARIELGFSQIYDFYTRV